MLNSVYPLINLSLTTSKTKVMDKITEAKECILRAIELLESEDCVACVNVAPLQIVCDEISEVIALMQS